MSSWRRRRQSIDCGTLLLLLGAAACGGGGSSPAIPAEITLSSTDVTMDAVGQSVQLTATVLDESGGPISGAAVDWVSAGPAIVTVSATGELLAQAPGTAEVTATAAGDVTASASVIVESIATLQVLEGNGQTAAAGAPVPTAPAVEIRDASDQPVPGVHVRFQVGTASGSVTGEIQTTGADGIARVGAWRLGSSGINSLTASVEGAELVGEPAEFVATTVDPSGYNITVRYLGNYTTAQLEAFADAELRWESLVTGDLPDVNQTLDANTCGNNPVTSGPFDDLTIFVSIDSIDGPFGTLGQAGPCFVRVPGNLTVVGRMQFDRDDMELLESEGALQAVILHEMGHVLGFGTLWNSAGLLVDPADADNPGANDPHFTGAQALIAFDGAGGSTYTGAKVPVMNVGGAGTINSHWRDEVFDPELMTGFLTDGFNPLSVITVRSLQDLGYTVNVAGADPFTLTAALRAAGPRRGRPLVNDVITDPIRQIDASGRVIGVIRR